MTLKEFQSWLVSRGQRIAVDGKPGSATRAAIIAAFTNRHALPVTAEQIAGYATRLGGSVKQVNAVSTVESAGGGFNEQGQPKALYERHYAWKRLRVLIP